MSIRKIFVSCMKSTISAPIRRSRLRRNLGRIFYIFKRYYYWYYSRTEFSTEKCPPLSHVIFNHETPLLRKLKNVDMYLQYNKICNLNIAASRITGVVIYPGQTFSFWYLVRKPSSFRGFKKGMVLEDGKIRTGTGGGLCQLSNLIFWMTLHTPLSVTERYRHSYDVFPDSNRTLPFGSGATCAYNYIDLQIKNETDHKFQLILELDSTHLKGEWRSDFPSEFTYEIIEKDHLIHQEFWGGYVRSNKLYRRIKDVLSDKIISEEFLFENHALMMYNPLLEHTV